MMRFRNRMCAQALTATKRFVRSSHVLSSWQGTIQSTFYPRLSVAKLDLSSLRKQKSSAAASSAGGQQQPNDPKSSQAESPTNGSSSVVYESPLASAVGKLRSVSLLTAVVGTVGVPSMVALKGGIGTATGVLAVAMTFVAGSMGSTAAIHFVFGPYVYKMERIPFEEDASPQETEGVVDIGRATVNGEGKICSPETVLRANTRSLFLQPKEIVFDPRTDVEPYKGFRPLCNFVAKGKPLYVHPEYLYDNELLNAMKLSKAEPMPSKENPDDFL